MIKRKRKRRKQMRNKHSFWWWVCAALAVLITILIIDLKPWRKSRSVVSDQWPYHDMTKGPYSKDFDGLDISRHQGKIHWDELVEENPQLRLSISRLQKVVLSLTHSTRETLKLQRKEAY